MQLGFDLILLGDPTSGKDTQALLLSKKYNVKLARSGEFLRKYKARQYVSGSPAPTSLILPFLRGSLKNIGSRDLIFVGAARLLNEAKYLVKLLNKEHRDFFALYLKLPNKEIYRRSKLRSKRKEDKHTKLINSRINYHKNLVSKTVKYYKNLKKLKFINATQSIGKVSKDILQAIHDYQRSKRN